MECLKDKMELDRGSTTTNQEISSSYCDIDIFINQNPLMVMKILNHGLQVGHEEYRLSDLLSLMSEKICMISMWPCEIIPSRTLPYASKRV
ncbi:hypothetical protein CDAR_395501 [Caerostris darwini]|uniref:Uncharacterized protein n=1 Tax=Caerostris darwini TaxID=1538125 RepID=A0AAV4M6R6_9ARAC|nr:hypothetical protein CDAR_395501 [Caerostris darwini]